MLNRDLIRNIYYRDGVEITAEEYAAEFEIIKTKAEWTRKVFSGIANIEDVPDEWREEIENNVANLQSSAEEDGEISSEEALEIIMRGAK
ncbi:MAG: hypothetical protein ACI4OB_07095 [Christensenellales bacterium]